MTTCKQTFIAHLAEVLDGLFSGPEFASIVTKHTPFAWAERLTDGLIEGTADNKSTAIKMTCKHFGIPATYKSIRSALTEGDI